MRVSRSWKQPGPRQSGPQLKTTLDDQNNMNSMIGQSAVVLATVGMAAQLAIAQPTMPEFTFRPGDVLRFDWRAEHSQAFSGAASMTFVDEGNRQYRLEVVAVEQDRYLLSARLLRHWGHHEDSITGSQKFDSSSADKAESSSWRLSSEVDKDAEMSLARKSLELTPEDAESSTASEAIRFLRFVLYSGSTIVIREEATSGAIELECVPSEAETRSRETMYSCETGEVKETSSANRFRQGVGDQIVKMLGPGKLKKATVEGEWRMPGESTLPVSVVIVTGITQTFGKKREGVVWEYTGHQTGTLRLD